MVRKLALSLVALSLLGAPAFAAASDTTAQPRTAQTAASAKPVARSTVKARAATMRKHRVAHRKLRHHRHTAGATLRPATRT